MFFAVLYCSTLITGGIKLNGETGKLNITKVSRTVGTPKIQLPKFPENYDRDRSLVIMNNGDIFSCGGKSRTCFILEDHLRWVYHSTLNYVRLGAVIIQMPEGIYVFGGIESPNTSEFLANNAENWRTGPDVPYFASSMTSIGLKYLKRFAKPPSECDYKINGHAISNTELILINEDCIIKGRSYEHHFYTF